MNLFQLNRANPSPARRLQTIDAHTLKQWLEQQTVTLVDVRELNEYRAGHIPGATLLSLSAFDPGKIPQSAQRVVLYCRSGQRSTMAAQKLLSAGFPDVTHLGGGISAWTGAGYSTQAG